MHSAVRSRALPSWVASLVASCVLGGLLARALLAFHGPRIVDQAEQAHRVLERSPYSAAHQSRLLEPALVLFGTSVTRLDWVASYVAVLVVLSVAVIVATVVAFRLWLGSWGEGLRYGVLQAALVLLLQDRQWLHLSDLLDVLMATAFAYAVFTQARTRWLVALFAIAIWNRESALFIPLWLVLSALPASSEGKRTPIAMERLMVGLSGIAVGLIGIGAARHLLYAGRPAPHRLVTPWGSHVTVKHNLYDAWRALSGHDAEAFSVYAAIAVAATLVYLSRRRLAPEARRVPLLLAAMAASIPVFSLVLETRSWLVTTPFLLFVHRAATAGSMPRETPDVSNSEPPPGSS